MSGRPRLRDFRLCDRKSVWCGHGTRRRRPARKPTHLGSLETSNYLRTAAQRDASGSLRGEHQTGGLPPCSCRRRGYQECRPAVFPLPCRWLNVIRWCASSTARSRQAGGGEPIHAPQTTQPQAKRRFVVLWLPHPLQPSAHSAHSAHGFLGISLQRAHRKSPVEACAPCALCALAAATVPASLPVGVG